MSWILRTALKCCCERVDKWLSGGPSQDPQHPHQKPGMVTHDCNLSSGEAETRGSLRLAGLPAEPNQQALSSEPILEVR